MDITLSVIKADIGFGRIPYCRSDPSKDQAITPLRTFAVRPALAQMD